MIDQLRLFSDAVAEPLSAEAKLLLRVAALGRTEFFSRAEDVAQLTANVDWKTFLALADHHRLLPLAFQTMKVLQRGVIPERLLKSLWTRYASNLQRNRQMTTELDRMLAALGTSRIHAAALKGPALAGLIFGDVGVREFSDLDILVRQRDVFTARSILCLLGYAPVYALRPEDESAYLLAGRQYDIVLYSEASATTVELHWRTSTDAAVERLDDPGWWRELVQVRVEGICLPTLPPHELLLFLCVHGAKHCWERLAWLVDVAEIVHANPDLDWAWVRARANEIGARKRLAIGLTLATQLLALRLPEAVAIDEIWSGSLASPLAKMRHRLAGSDASGGSREGELLLRLSLYDSWRQRLRQFLLLVFTPNSADWSHPGTHWLPRPLLKASRLLQEYAKQRLAAVSRG